MRRDRCAGGKAGGKVGWPTGRRVASGSTSPSASRLYPGIWENQFVPTTAVPCTSEQLEVVATATALAIGRVPRKTNVLTEQRTRAKLLNHAAHNLPISSLLGFT